MNLSLCIEEIYSSNELDGLRYALNHSNVHKFRLGRQHRHFVFEDSNGNHQLDPNFLDAATECLSTRGRMTSSSTVPSMTHLHFDIQEANGLTVLDCVLRTTTNLRSLHIGLEGLDIEDPYLSTALISINNSLWRKSLQTLDMNVELKCSQLPGFMRKSNELPSELILTLKIHLTISHQSQLDDNAPCQKAAPLLGTLKQPHRLKELTLMLPSHYFLSAQDFIMFTGLKHLSIGFDNLGFINDKSFDGLYVLNELGSLEICNTQFAKSAMESFLKSLSQLTLRKLMLNNVNLTDHDVGLLAKVLSDSMYELESLSLRYNSITGAGVKSLVKALKSHSKFYSLDLSGNPIKESEGLETLKKLNTLRVLNLTNCDIGDMEIEKLANVLASNKNLCFLNLSGNPFIGSETGLAPLANLTSLHQLDITGWSNSSQVIDGYLHYEIQAIKKRDETLSNVLKHLTQLRLLNLCLYEDVPVFWSHELASALSHLSELQLLNAPMLGN